MRSVFVIILIILFVSCSVNSESESSCVDTEKFVIYTEFFHVKELVDYQTEEITYIPIEQKLTPQECDSLVEIFEDRMIEYKRCGDSTILVKMGVGNITNYTQMSVYDRILREKVKTNLPSWEYINKDQSH